MQAAAAPATRRAQPPERAEPLPRMRSRISVGRGSLLSQAIRVVLHHPAAASTVAREALAGVDLPGMAVLHELIEQAAGMNQPSTAMLLERWRDRPEHARLTELAMAPSIVSDDKGAAQELKMAVQKLVESHGPGRRMNELLQKAAVMDLNFDEKTELSLLLKGKDRPGGLA
jgi:DNA primase